MEFIYSNTVIGFNHISKEIVCQDHSDYYIDNEYKIITACDGHGGKIYIRSDKGAKFASQAVIDVITKYSDSKMELMITNNLLEKIKLEVLCKWNELVEQDYSFNHFSQAEFEHLSEEEQFKLENNYIMAYGTTLNAAIISKNHVICIQIGDGGLYLINNNKIELVFPDNDDNVANITYSLCGDNAYDNIYIKAVVKEEYNGIIICTDGLLGPYQTYENFYDNFINPFINSFKVITKDRINDLDAFIEELGKQTGTGDDVSFASILY